MNRNRHLYAHETIVERLERLSVPEPNSGCWLWLGSMNPSGYGSLVFQSVPQYAHRAAYKAFVGLIPNGLEIDHLCRVRCCINPQHLEAVTHRVNVLRGLAPQAFRAARAARQAAAESARAEQADQGQVSERVA